MNKKFMFITASAALLLAACGNSSDIKGAELYADGEYQSYLKAYDYFEGVLEKEPDNNEAREQIQNIQSQFLKLTKALIDESFENLQPIEAKKYLDAGLGMVPTDEQLMEVNDMITQAAKDQMSLNSYTNFMEEVYTQFNEGFQGFSEVLTKANTGNATLEEVVAYINTEYPKIVELRKQLDENTYGYVSDGYASLADINTDLFNYFVEVEKELSNIISKSTKLQEGYDIKTLNGDLSLYNAAQINARFLKVQKGFVMFVTQKDKDEALVYHVENTLNFSENKKSPTSLDDVKIDGKAENVKMNEPEVVEENEEI